MFVALCENLCVNDILRDCLLCLQDIMQFVRAIVVKQKISVSVCKTDTKLQQSGQRQTLLNEFKDAKLVGLKKIHGYLDSDFGLGSKGRTETYY